MSPVEVNFHGGEVKDDGLYKLQETDLDGDVLDFEEQIFDEEKIYMHKMAEKTTEEETVEAMARGLIVPAVSKNCSAYDQRNQKKANKKRKKIVFASAMDVRKKPPSRISPRSKKRARDVRQTMIFSR